MPFDRSLIDKYEAGGEQLAQSIRSLTREDLLAKPKGGPELGKWTIHEVVIHMMDSDLIGADRMKRLIAEDARTRSATMKRDSHNRFFITNNRPKMRSRSSI